MATDEADGGSGDGGDETADEDATDDEVIGAAVVTVSSTRSLEDDEPGDAVVSAFEDAGHELATRELIESGYDNVQSIVTRLVDRGDVDVVVTTGGTGVSPDDVTLEAISPLLDKELPAFGDLFTRLGYEEVGTGVLCTRTMAGVSDGVPIFCLPAHATATDLATTSIIVPEGPKLVSQAVGDRASPGEVEE
ncbi:MogA/MoaB family molybdenum cofactor biosynthesis protein [Natronoglomus mannanivorans]|uniref:Molybdopterin-binding protein n=1 Tax=Natronoglomus mannanivorans TaxID=2979990 RepID=A0AAP2YXL3_9EURY|nr:molybdopterin-binding protein [Halobacteria archaeon AArc-xg1-1]